MNKVKIDLANCYGIKKLQAQFDFSQQKAYAIYAPNGAMKSSLADTFKDVAEGVPSKDRIFASRKTKRTIVDESGTPLSKDSILVIRPYDDLFGHTEKTSTLLVNATLRKEYEQLHVEIGKSTDAFLQALKKQSGSKKDLQAEISSTFTKSADEFYQALVRVKSEVDSQPAAPFADIAYDTIFDEKVLGFLNTQDFKVAVAGYVHQYNKLLAASTYFKRGTFTYYNAATIAKSLADNGFFDAKHTVSLNATKNLEIVSQKQLEELIAKEKEGIAKDASLRKKFADIEKQINKNVNVRDFHAYLSQHEELLAELANIEKFKEDIWKSYFKANAELYADVVAKYQSAEKRRKEIEEAAKQEQTQWETVIEIFNERFFVPFKLEATNKVSVMLGKEAMLSLGFTFEDGADSAPVDRTTLMQALSTGEKKALYILNIIFEVEARRRAKQETLLVVDDIADSFDYKNKYAIIQYLKDISEDSLFCQIILTHNFDFFRTINSRFVGYPQCLMAFKDSAGIALSQAAGIKNPFVNDWKPNFFKDAKKRIASIPFLRNIVEYTRGEHDPSFQKLTSLLHWKADTGSIIQADLDLIYFNVFGEKGISPDTGTPVVDAIRREADACLKAKDGVNFENKIVLSMAIRLITERLMVEKLSDPSFVKAIEANQTARLYAEYKRRFPGESKALGIIERVMLMTPENIHLNSFMYEPILDMSDEHLKRLYRDVIALKP